MPAILHARDLGSHLAFANNPSPTLTMRLRGAARAIRSTGQLQLPERKLHHVLKGKAMAMGLHGCESSSAAAGAGTPSPPPWLMSLPAPHG